MSSDHDQPHLSPKDQKLVDEFTSSGVNKEERQPFHPWKLMLWLALLIIIFGILARFIGNWFLPY